MSWTFDPDRFDADVLDAARRGERLGNWFQRYQLPLDASDKDVETALDTVRTHLNKRTQGRHRDIAPVMLVDHQKAKAELDPSTRAAYRDRVLQADRTRLTELLAEELKGGRHVSNERLAWIAALVPALDGATVRTQAQAAGLVVEDAVELPHEVAGANAARIAALLTTLGHEHVVGYLFGGSGAGAPFAILQRFSGQESLERGLSRAEAAAKTAKQDARQGAVNELHGLLDQVVKADPANGLRSLAVLQLATAMRSAKARLGLTKSGLVVEAERLGLVRAEAELLAFAVAEERDTGADIRAALAEGRLGDATRLVAALGPAASSALGGLAEEVELAVKEARRHRDEGLRRRAAGDDDGAVRAFMAAAEIAKDDDSLIEAIRRCAPGPPVAAQARSEGGTVVVQWQPSRSSVGTITYRVVRSRGGPVLTIASGEVLTDVEAGPFVDTGAPPGVEVQYGIFAQRDGAALSPEPARTGGVVVTPAVTGFHLSAGESEIEGHWVLPDNANRITVVRRRDRAPTACDDGRLIKSASEFFRDTGLEAGVTYYYRIAAVYLLPDGTERHSDGSVASATPEVAPEPVLDLHAELEEELVLAVLRWTSPPSGDVRVLVSTAPPAAAGQIVPIGALAGMGEFVAAPARRTHDGRMELLAPLRGGRAAYTPVTLSGSRAAVGRPCSLVALLPVTGLRCQAFRESILVQWVFPPNCQQALVAWRAGEPPKDPEGPGAMRAFVSSTEYKSNGGFRLPAAGAGYGIAVFAVSMAEHGVVYSRPQSAAGVGLGATELSYELVRRGWRRRKMAVRLEVPDHVTDPPEFVLVAGPGGVRPLRPDDGTLLVRIPAGSTGDRLVRLPGVPRRSYIRGFLVGTTPSDFVLRDPPARQLRPVSE